MREFFRKMVRNQMIMAVVSIILGIILIAYQGSAVAQIIRLIGYILLIGAVVCIISYFAGKENKGNPSTLATGILCILFGIVCVRAPQWLIAFFPVVMGIVLIVSSIFNLSAAFSAPVKGPLAGTSALLSLLTLILGIMAVADPVFIADFLIVFIGITFLVNGVSDLVAIAMMKR